jgi:hypothetical protein
VGLLEQVQTLAPELWLKEQVDQAGEPSSALMALEATVSGPVKSPVLSGRISDGVRASGRRAGREQLEHGETVPGIRSVERRVSRESLVPLTPVPGAAVPVESPSRESLAPASAVSTRESTRRLSQRRFIAILGGLLTVALVALVLSRRGGSSPAQSASGHVETARAVRMVRWHVVSAPPGAEVRSEGKYLGNTPWVVERPAGPGETALTLSYDGYQDKTIVLSHSIEVTTEVRLVPRVLTPTTSTTSATSGPASPPAGDSADSANRKPAKSKGSKAHKSRPQDDDVKLLID